PPEVIQLPPVEVIGTTPLPALGVPLEKYPGNAQRVTAEDIKKQNLVNLPEQLFRNFGSVNTIGAQGNPWQNDLTYRGFLGGLLGTLDRRECLRRLARPVRLVSRVQRSQRERLARRVAHRSAPVVRQGGLPDVPVGPRAELHLRQQQARR